MSTEQHMDSDKVEWQTHFNRFTGPGVFEKLREASRTYVALISSQADFMAPSHGESTSWGTLVSVRWEKRYRFQSYTPGLDEA